MDQNVQVVSRFKDLPEQTDEGKTFYVQEIQEWLDKPAYHVFKKGAYRIEYLKGEMASV